MSTFAQMFVSYLLLIGFATGIAATVMLTLHRFIPQRRLLAVLAVMGYGTFICCTMMLTPSTVRLVNFYWWLFTAAVVGGAFGCVTMRNVFHSALMLILSLFGVGGYFILVNAEFLAMVQVIIYIGGIMVLFLFGIMVSQNIIGTEVRQNTPQSPWAGVFAGLLFLFMTMIGLLMTFPPDAGKSFPVFVESNTQSIGWSLMSTYALPFEVASVLLLMAMLGAIILVRKD